MSLDSLLQGIEQLREEAEQEISVLEGEIRERQDHIKKIRALFSRPKTPKVASPPKASKASNYVSREAALRVGESIWANRGQLDEFAARDLGDSLAPMKADRIRASLERLHEIRFVRVVKPQSGPHPTVWSLYPDSSLELLHAHLKEDDGNGAS